MRLITIKTPSENAEEIIRLAFDVGIESVSLFDIEKRSASGEHEPAKCIEVEGSTSKAKHFLDRVMTDPSFLSREISISTKQPRAVLSNEEVRDVTVPMPEPAIDLMEELWQFSHITYGLVGRVLISAGLLAYGLIEQKLLLMIAGLMFLPILPMLMAISFGIGARQWRLAVQGLASTVLSLALLFVGGVIVSSISDPPVRYDDFSSTAVSVIISAAVGVAAALASIDDAGRRELIGLAAASQMAIIPSWLGACVVFGLPGDANGSEIVQLLTTLAASFATIVTSVLIVQRITGVTHHAERREKQ